MTVRLDHPDGSATHRNEGTADAAPGRRFGTVAVVDDSEPLLDDPGDRVQVVVDLSAIDRGATLAPGESATLVLETRPATPGPSPSGPRTRSTRNTPWRSESTPKPGPILPIETANRTAAVIVILADNWRGGLKCGTGVLPR